MQKMPEENQKYVASRASARGDRGSTREAQTAHIWGSRKDERSPLHKTAPFMGKDPLMTVAEEMGGQEHCKNVILLGHGYVLRMKT